MPKKKAHIMRKSDALLPSALLAGLRNAGALMERKRAGEAIALLEDLDQRYPNRVEVLTDLLNAAYDTKNMQLYERAAEALHKLTPSNAELTMALSNVHFKNAHFALAALAARDFLARWPQHPQVEEAKEISAQLDELLPQYLEGMRLAGPDALELVALHEKTQMLLENRQYPEARQTAKQLLDRRPYAPTLNNVSQSYYAEGDIDTAIVTARSVLDFEPENVHALSNLVHFAVITGFMEEAKEFAQTLKTTKAYGYQKEVKIAEALTFVGDDAGVLAAYKRAEANREKYSDFDEPFLHHLAGVAAMRQGKQAAARKHWEYALTLDPKYDLAKQNLADLSLPVEERHAPWPFPLSSWALKPAIRDMQEQMANAVKTKKEDALPEAVHTILRRHPEVAAVVPILLEKGDMLGRTYALMIAGNSEDPDLQQALRDFVSSSHGPDAMRLQALQTISEAEQMETGTPVRMFIKGEWKEIASMNYEIYEEPMVRHSERVQNMMAQGMEAIFAKNAKKAEELFTEALEEYPDDPTILNNLATSYQAQGRDEDFREMIRYVHERHPDYFFARVNMARISTRDGELEAARTILEPLTKQRKMHVSEFSALAAAQIEWLIAKEEPKGAEIWLQLWEQVAPDNPNIAALKPRLELASLASNIAEMAKGFTSRRKRKAK